MSGAYRNNSRAAKGDARKNCNLVIVRLAGIADAAERERQILVEEVAVLGCDADALRVDVDKLRAKNDAEASCEWTGNFLAPAFSDEALALRFAEAHAADLRYVAAWGRWLSWTGTHWRFDSTLRAFDLAREICRQAAASCNNAKTAKTIASAQAVAAVERLAKTDRRLAATVEQWDADPWLLNTPEGVIDLRNGQRRAARADDYMTKITAVAPAGACPLFLAFLDRITGDDRELVSYVARLFGYALTGDTCEQALFFFYGSGANGKSVLLSTISRIAGDYHKASSAETFTVSNNDRHSTEIAGLRGARLVTASETEEGRRWAESRIKQLTGGDMIEARFMRQDNFQFRPVFKLVIAGNHKPSFRSVDEAIRRRFHLVPFAVTIPPEERDPQLTEKLKTEWPGILQWLINGCVEWRRTGLSPPKAVKDATAAYLESEDAVAIWLEETCERTLEAWASSAELFFSWSHWAERSGEFAGTKKALEQALVNRGFERHKRNSGVGFLGICLKGSV